MQNETELALRENEAEETEEEITKRQGLNEEAEMILEEENYIARKAAKSDAEEEASAKLEAELI